MIQARKSISPLVPLDTNTLVVWKSLIVNWLPTVIALPYGLRGMFLKFVFHETCLVGSCESAVWMVTNEPSHGSSETWLLCSLPFVLSLSSFCSSSLLMVSAHIFTTPCQADLFWANLRQSYSRPHFIRSQWTRSFQWHYWPPADRAPYTGAHTSSCLSNR